MLVGYHYDWTYAKTYTIPTTSPTVIAIKGYNFYGLGGFIGNFSDGSVTDSSWKCARNVSDDWYKTNFNDSSWPKAQATNFNRSLWGLSPAAGISESAQWIWSGSFSDKYVTVYCRKKIGTVLISHEKLRSKNIVI